MKLLWATDIHLDCASKEARANFVERINHSHADIILITGDIATGTTIIDELDWLKCKLNTPFYFVLGNHDYYDASITKVREQISKWTQSNQQAFWLDEAQPVQLSERRFLVGDGGWGDARNGDFLQTPIRLNDHRMIQELSGLDRSILQQKLQLLGSESQDRLKGKLEYLFQSANHIDEVIIATHVPPFPESAWYMGYSGAIDWIPDFTCKAIGDLLLTLSDRYPDIQWTVLCGHGHHSGTANIRDNLTVYTGAAEYGSPNVAKILQFT